MYPYDDSEVSLMNKLRFINSHGYIPASSGYLSGLSSIYNNPAASQAYIDHLRAIEEAKAKEERDVLRWC